MKSLTLLLTSISLSVSLLGNNQCTCTELTVQNDCTMQGCIWAKVNSVSFCVANTVVVDCAGKQQSECDQFTDCAWTNAGACAAFTKCADYTVTTAGQCNLKDITCSDGVSSGTSIQCQTITCSTLTSTNCLGNFQSDGKLCYYQDSACAAYDVSSCSAITNKDLCNLICYWSGTACVARTCASITDTTQCTYVLNNDLASISICTVQGTTCADANDTSALTETTCNAKTFNTYEWNGSQCSACYGNLTKETQTTTNSYILTIMIMSFSAAILF